MRTRARAGSTRLRTIALMWLLLLAGVASYRIVKAWRGEGGGPTTTAAGGREGVKADTRQPVPFPSGRYLVAFVLLSSECGFCRQEDTKNAIRRLRASLRASHGASFVNVSVVGIASDRDLRKGVQYLETLGPLGSVFDQLSVGGSWLNEQVATLVWRGGVATPEVPQVVLVERLVDAGNYPAHIDIQRDSLLLVVAGLTDVVRWVNDGTPLKAGRASYRPS